MKASLSWINEYTPVVMDTRELVDALTMLGLEVDSVTDRYAHLATVVVGHVVSVAPHPNADRLKLCQVDAGNGILSVVCGAPNVEAGTAYPLALVGTVLREDFVLSETKIRGEKSQGMLCSRKELRLGEDHSGIMPLPADLAPGTPITKALNLADATLDIDLTPNRPDCLSIIGIAREVAAIQHTDLTPLAVKIPEANTGSIMDKTAVTIEAPDHCPRYTAALIEDVRIGPSPAWLQERLLSVGLRPINNVVDITNFVMMETGQPLHAFDFDRLAENRIVVRTAHDGEEFQTLDNKVHRLSTENLMICDGKKPVAVGGVMGGLNSEIEETTTRVLLESAYFSPTSVRKTAKKLGINTDASHRFERGVDPDGTLTALVRAAELMVSESGGKMVQGVIDVHPAPADTCSVMVTLADINRVLGIDITLEEAKTLLESIEFGIAVQDDGVSMAVTVPTFRVDIQRSIDVIEEVARLYGYDRIPTTFPENTPQAKIPKKSIIWRDRIKHFMNALGFSEAINYSFVDSRSWDQLNLPETDVRRKATPILNPLTEEQAVMRTMVLPSLLKNMHRNLALGNSNLKLFEVAKVFVDKHPGGLPEETLYLAGLWTGARYPVSWHDAGTRCDFYDIKGTLEGLLEKLAVPEASFTALDSAACAYTRPGYSARISIAQTDVGIVGELHPDVAKNFDLKQTAYLFEIDLSALVPMIPDVAQAGALPRYPAVHRDFTLIIGQEVESHQILRKIKGFEEPLIEEVYLFDMFDGKPIPEGKKSLSFRIRYRAEDRTLADEEINGLHKAIAGRIIDLFKAALPT